MNQTIAHYKCILTLYMSNDKDLTNPKFIKGQLYKIQIWHNTNAQTLNETKNMHYLGSIRGEWFKSRFELIPPKTSKPRRTEVEEKFINFLKENNALIPFCCNLAKKEDEWINKPFFSHLKEETPTYWIDNAFAWDLTIEGHMYWDAVEQKWWKIINYAQ